MVGAMEQMEVESATCSSRTLITGLPYSHMQMSDQIFLYGVIENHPPLHPYCITVTITILSTCYSDGGVGGYGMSWFDAMECCYYNKVAIT